ncbi:MAG: aminopeptidase P family protein, partial [Bacteroidetes bacterium]
MFEPTTYLERRKTLKEKLGRGLVLLPGNDESPMNYADNPYHFRQDSTFLYYFGLSQPGLNAVIDVDNDREILFGDDYTVEDFVWMGPQPTMAELAAKCGVREVRPAAMVANELDSAKHRKQTLHFLPPYRSENKLKLQRWTVTAPGEDGGYSVDLVRAVVSQREIKTEEEIRELHRAVDISVDMHVAA